jgi:hypothetical protein
VSDAYLRNIEKRLSTESGNSCRYKIELEKALKTIKIHGMTHNDYISFLKKEIYEVDTPIESIFNSK